MACVNPNDPRFLEILQQVGNPLLAEIEFDKLYPFEEERIADMESRMFEEPNNVYVPLSEEHRQLLESAKENLNPVEADRVEQMLKGETRFLDDSNFEMC
jgi:hypothetical protein